MAIVEFVASRVTSIDVGWPLVSFWKSHLALLDDHFSVFNQQGLLFLSPCFMADLLSASSLKSLHRLDWTVAATECHGGGMPPHRKWWKYLAVSGGEQSHM